MVELWAISNPNNTWVLRQTNSKIAVCFYYTLRSRREANILFQKIGRKARTALYYSVKLALGIGRNTVLTYAALTRNGGTSVQSWPARTQIFVDNESVVGRVVLIYLGEVGACLCTITYIT